VQPVGSAADRDHDVCLGGRVALDLRGQQWQWLKHFNRKSIDAASQHIVFLNG
jgi:hypothetical protein